MSRLAAERRVAIEAVLAASRLCQSVFNTIVAGQTLIKGDKSPVTIADFGAQAVVNSFLQRNFPLDPIVGEEDANDLRENLSLRDKVLDLVNSVADKPIDSKEMLSLIDLGQYAGGPRGRFWTLDPIDGTKGFLRGEQFAVALALIIDGKVELGVLGCPNLPTELSRPDGDKGCLFIAVRGEGAVQRSISSGIEFSIRCTSANDPSTTIFCESVESGHSNQTEAERIGQKLGITKKSVRMDSQCKYGIVARGDAGIYLRVPTSASYEEKIWDHAAGALLIEEAGGVVTDVSGATLDFSHGRTLIKNKGVIACGSHFSDATLSAVKSVLKL